MSKSFALEKNLVRMEIYLQCKCHVFIGSCAKILSIDLDNQIAGHQSTISFGRTTFDLNRWSMENVETKRRAITIWEMNTPQPCRRPMMLNPENQSSREVNRDDHEISVYRVLDQISSLVRRWRYRTSHLRWQSRHVRQLAESDGWTVVRLESLRRVLPNGDWSCSPSEQQVEIHIDIKIPSDTSSSWSPTCNRPSRCAAQPS